MHTKNNKSNNHTHNIPLRPLSSALMAHYRSNGAPSSNIAGLPALESGTNPSILTMSNTNNLYEDDQHALEAYAMGTPRRMIRQAPKLLTLDDYNLISLGYKPVCLERKSILLWQPRVL